MKFLNCLDVFSRWIYEENAKLCTLNKEKNGLSGTQQICATYANFHFNRLILEIDSICRFLSLCNQIMIMGDG